MSVKLRPIGDQVAVIRDEIVDKTESGIILQDTSKVVPGSGTVFAVGPYADEVNEGDTVYFSALMAAKGGRGIEVEGQVFIILKMDDLYCIVNKVENDGEDDA